MAYFFNWGSCALKGLEINRKATINNGTIDSSIGTRRNVALDQQPAEYVNYACNTNRGMAKKFLSIQDKSNKLIKTKAAKTTPISQVLTYTESDITDKQTKIVNLRQISGSKN
jgi:hypothetical protein